MKTFETPVVDVKKFEMMDILTTSQPTEETDPPVECPTDWEIV